MDLSEYVRLLARTLFRFVYVFRDVCVFQPVVCVGALEEEAIYKGIGKRWPLAIGCWPLVLPLGKICSNEKVTDRGIEF